MASQGRFILTSKTTGFTLVELVIVIILIGALAAFALPKLLSSGSFEDYTVRDQLVSRLRISQLQNMNADPSPNAAVNACYWTVVQVSAAGRCIYSLETVRSGASCTAPAASISCDASAPEHQGDPYDLVGFSSKVTISPANYLFDYHGIEQVGCGNSFPCDISINSGNHLSIRIEQQGYIHVP
ncbi:type IV pilin protein [Motilimonas sp. 1_MG-2023]|uniref:type IV pilin protein n=1 Tax=Motilimonas TaxID=1914248 RepID=UPI0026E2C1AB|nr:prepilin-type N-terminal cleavage/methylation domain-containing protein [Motilimonas sp. 1_MG-2023]MDO6524148.1 prepilin-type N-terminal cleavage/methylation domain-containing protein [Motilimonas sp. 1_MG-2023]